MRDLTPETLLERFGLSAVPYASAWERQVASLTERLESERRNILRFKHVDATPDEDYPLRILRAYREDCNLAWATTTDGTPSDSLLVKALNDLQMQRAAILDRAIAALAAEEGKR